MKNYNFTTKDTKLTCADFLHRAFLLMKLTFMHVCNFKICMFRSELSIIYLSGILAQINLHSLGVFRALCIDFVWELKWSKYFVLSDLALYFLFSAIRLMH